MSYEAYIAGRYLRGKKGSPFISAVAVISVLGVAVGVATLIVVLAVMNGAQIELRDRILGTNAHIVVLKYHNEPINEYDKIVAQINEVEGINGASPFIYAKAMVSHENYADGIVIRGINKKYETEVTDIKKNMISGNLNFEGHTHPGIILGVGLADILRAHIGDVVTVASPYGGKSSPFGFIPKMQRFFITGLFDSGFFEYNNSLAYISLEDAQDFFELPEAVTGIEVKLFDMYSAGSVARHITKKLGYPFRANTWMELNRNLLSALSLEKKTMFVILTLIIIVAAFGISSSLIMIVMRKTKEIGILKSMGATPKSIRKIFIIEGFSVGIVGTVIGILVGVGISLLLQKYEFISLPGEIYFISKLPCKIKLNDCILISLAAVSISFIATIYPSYKASKLMPVEAIRYE